MKANGRRNGVVTAVAVYDTKEVTAVGHNIRIEMTKNIADALMLVPLCLLCNNFFLLFFFQEEVR